jgi:hypothetical protein
MRPPLLALALALCACATVRSGVDLDFFRGAYATHFDGIPDRSAICAVVSNRTAAAVGWVRLRLESHSRLGDEPGRWVSYWVWRGHLAPGDSVALELSDPPVADQIRLNLRGAGTGGGPASGRTAQRVDDCSDLVLQARLGSAGRQVVQVVRRNEGAHEEILVASEQD